MALMHGPVGGIMASPTKRKRLSSNPEAMIMAQDRPTTPELTSPFQSVEWQRFSTTPVSEALRVAVDNLQQKTGLDVSPKVVEQMKEIRQLLTQETINQYERIRALHTEARAKKDKKRAKALKKAYEFERQLRHHRAVMRTEFSSEATMEERMPDDDLVYVAAPLPSFRNMENELEPPLIALPEPLTYESQKQALHTVLEERHVLASSNQNAKNLSMVVDMWSLFDQVLNQVESILAVSQPLTKRMRLDLARPDPQHPIMSMHYLQTMDSAVPVDLSQSWNALDAEEMLMAAEEATFRVKAIRFTNTAAILK